MVSSFKSIRRIAIIRTDFQIGPKLYYALRTFSYVVVRYTVHLIGGVFVFS